MRRIPNPLTLEQVIAQDGREGSEQAYDAEHGFDYAGADDAFLYYGGKPFTGLYYELYPSGKLELYSRYQDGMPAEDCFEFYENGAIKAYCYISKDRFNRYSYCFDETGNLKRASVWENGKFTQEQF